jgi:hypothetical protein
LYRVVQWATGSMGRTALRRVIDHPDLDLVGVYVYDARKVGVDAGQIARRPDCGVLTTNRIDDIIRLQPDIVLHMSRVTMAYERQNEDVIKLLAAGIDVISIAGFHHPACHGEAYAAPLREACRLGGSTLAGVGLNPGFIAERIAALLSGLCARLDSIACYEVADASSMPSPEFVFGLMGFGADPNKRDITREPIANLYGSLYAEVLYAVAESLQTPIRAIVPEHSVRLAARELKIAAGWIEKGCVAGTEWRWRAQLENGIELLHSVLWTADPAQHGGEGGEAAAWRIELNGRPNVRATISLEDPDPAAPHMRAAVDATVAVALNAIPAVCAAPAGFFTVPPFSPFKSRLVKP